MMATALYARISQDDQGEEKGVKRQLEDARELAKVRGWTDVVEFTDNDLSAFSGVERPGYDALMRAVEAGEVERIVVYHGSRLWRSRRQRAEAMEILKAAEVRVAAVRGPELDFSTAYGRGMAGLLGEFDTMESDVKSERVARAAEARAMEGKANGAVAYGWQRVRTVGERGRETWRDVENPDEAKVVNEIVDRLLDGEAMRAIADDLNARSVLAPSRRPGVQWRHTSLRKVATRPANIGQRVHHGEVVGEAQWPPIVDEGKHARVCALLAKPGRRTTNTAARKHLLSYGIGECGVCGGVLRVARKRSPRKRGEDKVYELYVCEDSGCVGRSVPKVDELAEAAMIVRLERPDAARAFAVDTEAAQAASERAEELRARLNEAADQYADGAIDGEQMKRISDKLRPELEQAERRAREASPRLVDVPEGLLGDGAEEAWAGLNVARKRDLMQHLGLRVRIMPTEQGPGFDPDDVVTDFRVE